MSQRHSVRNHYSSRYIISTIASIDDIISTIDSVGILFLSTIDSMVILFLLSTPWDNISTLFSIMDINSTIDLIMDVNSTIDFIMDIISTIDSHQG